MEQVLDKNNKKISIGDTVYVPPTPIGDLWYFEFIGSVVDINYEERTAEVSDSDGYCWIISAKDLCIQSSLNN